MDEIFINDLLIRGVIGISDHERANRQDILINIVLYTESRKGGESDKIDDCINYRTAAKKVIAYAEAADRYTVEALAEDIAKLCLEDPKVASVKVKVEKPGAVRFARSVGVQIVRP